MDRRRFLTSLAIAPLLIKPLTAQQATTSQNELYPEKLQEHLERELEQDYKRYSLRREDIQRNNLKTAFSIVSPKTNTDLAFIVWCGERYTPVADFAFRYRDSRRSDKSHCDHYPYISLDSVPTPNTAGIFAFKEELACLVAKLADLTFREAMQSLFAIYRSVEKQIQRNKIDAADFQVMLKPEYRNRYTLEEIEHLHAFICDCYGNSAYYSMATITVERALNIL